MHVLKSHLIQPDYLACSSCCLRSSSSFSLCSRISLRFSARMRLASSGSVVPAEGLEDGGVPELSKRHHKTHFRIKIKSVLVKYRYFYQPPAPVGVVCICSLEVLFWPRGWGRGWGGLRKCSSSSFWVLVGVEGWELSGVILTGRRFPGSSALGDFNSLGVGGRAGVFWGGLWEKYIVTWR